MAKTILPPRQKKALDTLVRYHAKHGRPPTFFELGAELQITGTAANNLLKRLEAKGFVKLTPNISRGISILKEA